MTQFLEGPTPFNKGRGGDGGLTMISMVNIFILLLISLVWLFLNDGPKGEAEVVSIKD